MAKRQVITRQVIDDDNLEEAAEDEEKINAGVSLFALGLVEERKIEKVHIHRHDPEEGFLGEVPATATEADIKSKFGGSLFRLEAKNGQGRIVKVRHLRIAGDPIFVSESVERRWKKQNGIPLDGAAKSEHQMSMQDVMLLLEQREEKRRVEFLDKDERDRRERADKEERERKDREDREARNAKEQEDREDRRRKDIDEREERRRRQQAEDDDRRARQHREDMERLKADADKLVASQQAMFVQTLALFKAESAKAHASDPVEMLVKGMTLARELGGGGDSEPKDPLSILLGRAPELLSEIRQTASAAMQEVRGGPPAQEPPAEADQDPGVTFKGRSAKLMRAVAARMVAAGKDPEREFIGLAASYLKRQQKQQAAAAQPQEQTPAAPASGVAPEQEPPELPPRTMRRSRRRSLAPESPPVDEQSA